MPGMNFKLTYASMFDPPESLHQSFEAALARLASQGPRDHALYIDGRDHAAAAMREKFTPIDRWPAAGPFCRGQCRRRAAGRGGGQARVPAWSRLPATERVRLLGKVSEVIAERVYDIAAALSLEVGKNRMEALAEAQETADFFEFYGEDFLKRDFAHDLPNDPLKGFRSRNRSVMKPYGPWAVIAPFNFPFALAGGPVAAALATGNTVVLKGATDTPWAGRMLADCIHDAGLPPGVFNYVNGSGVGGGRGARRPPGHRRHHLHRLAPGRACRSRGAWSPGAVPRPCIAEMGGKNAVIVTARADLERATAGIVRSAFGMGGQKCSALSRIFVDERVADELIGARSSMRPRRSRVGDPDACARTGSGPSSTAARRTTTVAIATMLRGGGARILAGGRTPAEDGLGAGYYCLPTLAEAPVGPRRCGGRRCSCRSRCSRASRDRDAAMAPRQRQRARASPRASSAPTDEVDWFFDHIEAGVAYANRPQGATTGAWPGYQPFGGWKGSGTTGKGIASAYYLALYQREQSQTRVESA